jgi:hypothetical protein
MALAEADLTSRRDDDSLSDLVSFNHKSLVLRKRKAIGVL